MAPKLGAEDTLRRAEAMHGPFRDSFEVLRAFTPGTPERVRFTLPDVHHTFRPGHRVMIQVQSSWFPLVDLNPQTFVDPAKATEADFVAATHRLWRDAARPSKVTLPCCAAGCPDDGRPPSEGGRLPRAVKELTGLVAILG